MRNNKLETIGRPGFIERDVIQLFKNPKSKVNQAIKKAVQNGKLLKSSKLKRLSQILKKSKMIKIKKLNSLKKMRNNRIKRRLRSR